MDRTLFLENNIQMDFEANLEMFKMDLQDGAFTFMEAF